MVCLEVRRSLGKRPSRPSASLPQPRVRKVFGMTTKLTILTEFAIVINMRLADRFYICGVSARLTTLYTLHFLMRTYTSSKAQAYI